MELDQATNRIVAWHVGEDTRILLQAGVTELLPGLEVQLGAHDSTDTFTPYVEMLLRADRWLLLLPVAWFTRPLLQQLGRRLGDTIADRIVPSGSGQGNKGHLGELKRILKRAEGSAGSSLPILVGIPFGHFGCFLVLESASSSEFESGLREFASMLGALASGIEELSNRGIQPASNAQVNLVDDRIEIMFLLPWAAGTGKVRIDADGRASQVQISPLE